MKQPIRYFSIGLLVASLIIFIVFYFFEKTDNHASTKSIDEMIATIKDEGYHVLSSSEYISLSVGSETQNNDDTETIENEDSTNEEDSNDTQNENEDEDAEDEEDSDTEDAAEVHEYTLTIEPNMLGPTISEVLEDHNIIDDADEFNRYLETEGYAPYLQLGEHDVSSDMTNHEIAEIIARTR